jgi:hypothetical protein
MKQFFIVFLLLGNLINVCAQETKAKYTKIFKPNMYIGANVGINLMLSEHFREYLPAQPTNAMGYIGQASAGYNFTSVIGARGAIGLSNHRWPNKFNNRIFKFDTRNVVLDITYNMSNHFAGYNLLRPIDISIFAGAGYSQRILAGNPFYETYIARGGIQADYRLTHFIDLKLIGDINMVSDDFNDYVEGTPFDLYPALSVGFTYHFREKRNCNCSHYSRK